VIAGKELAISRSLESKLEKKYRLMHAEIGEWLTIWLRTPEMFDNWLALRLKSEEFQEWFGGENQNA
jgi:hypothetical protein